MNPFDDERNRLQEELSFRAEQALKRDDLTLARTLYTCAAVLEEDLARTTSIVDFPRIKLLFSFSACALWHKAGEHGRCLELAREVEASLPQFKEKFKARHETELLRLIETSEAKLAEGEEG